MKIFVVLPAYNESENIPALMEDLVRLKNSGEDLRAVMVDDGSADNSAALAESYKDRLDVTVVKHETNLGLGPTMRTGLRTVLASAKSGDMVVTMDADQSHPVNLIPMLKEKLSQGFDVVIASRYAPGGDELGLSKPRRVVSRICSWLFRLIRPIKNVRDYTCGYRMYRSDTLKMLAEKTGNNFFKVNGFPAMCELLLTLSKCNVKVGESPLTLRYDLKKGKSKMRFFRTTYQYLRVLICT